MGGCPGWAAEIVERMMELPMCGYWGFPANLLQICHAIREGRCPELVMNCYTVDGARKRLMASYVFCLDAWMNAAPPEVAAAELTGRRDAGDKNWPRIVAAVYAALGEASEVKRLLVRRLQHRLRWWIKTLIWFDDRRDRFLQDVYGGDVRGDRDTYGCYGNPPFGDPYFAELRLPDVQGMEERIRREVPQGEKILERIHSTWLCAPKAFRYVEKLILEIGRMALAGAAPESGEVLDCRETYPDFGKCAAWFGDFMGRLDKWLTGGTAAVPELGETTPVKHWLARLLRHKMQFGAEYAENFGKMVGRRPVGKTGTRPLA